MSSHIGRVNSSISDFISVLCQLFGSQMPAKITYLGAAEDYLNHYIQLTSTSRPQSPLVVSLPSVNVHHSPVLLSEPVLS